MAVDLSKVHINRALTNLSIMLASSDDTYMVPRICARRPVSALSDSFFQYGREAANRADTAGQSNVKFLPNVTNPGAEAPVIDQSQSTGTYQCRRYSYRDFVADRELEIADDPLNPLLDAGKIIRSRLLNDLEGLFGGYLADYDNYATTLRNQLTTGANGTSWNKASAAGTGSEPLTDIRVARIALEKSIQMEANTLALSAVTGYHLNDHDDLKGILQYTDATYLEGDGIPSTLRGLKRTVGKAVANTAKDGAAFSGDYLFGDLTEATATNQPCAIVCYVPPDRTIGPRGLASFIWFDAPDETTRQRGVSLRSYRDEGKRGWYIEGAITCDLQPGIVDGSSKITGAYLISRAAIP